MYYNNKDRKKPYLSDPISKELAWVNDFNDPYKSMLFCRLNLKVSITYTYYIYHNYTIPELAEAAKTSEEKVIEWILTAAYIVAGGHLWLDKEGFPEYNYLNQIYTRFPEAEKRPGCKYCVWSDIKTGHVICFQDCKRGKCFQQKGGK